MTGAEFIRRVQKLAKKTKTNIWFEPGHGKGSHGRLHYGSKFTTVKDRKKTLGTGLLRAMCRQIGIDPRDL